jgi:hypothetical protein
MLWFLSKEKTYAKSLGLFLKKSKAEIGASVENPSQLKLSKRFNQAPNQNRFSVVVP